MIDGDGFKVPCVTLNPPNSKSAVVVVHGYGGFKGETLGLAWRIAEKGFTTGAIDLRGHGEHLLDLDKNILSDLETAISHFKYYGKVTAMGHSLNDLPSYQFKNEDAYVIYGSRDIPEVSLECNKLKSTGTGCSSN